MPYSFWILGIVTVVSYLSLLVDHGEVRRLHRESTGKHRLKHLAKLVAIWGVPIGTSIAIAFQAFEIRTSNDETVKKDKIVSDATNRLAIAETKINETGARHLTKDAEKKLILGLVKLAPHDVNVLFCNKQETAKFTEELITAVLQGWPGIKVKAIPVALLAAAPGITLRMDPEITTGSSLEEIVTAFSAAGIKVFSEHEKTGDPPGFWIYVNEK